VFYRYFQDMPLKVIAKVTTEGAYILSWHPPDRKLGEEGYNASINNQRSGILMYNKNAK
jgi:hypothetical protein